MVPKVYLALGLPKQKVKTMRFSQLIAGEESYIEPLQKKKKTRLAKEKKDQAEKTTGIPHGKRSGDKEKMSWRARLCVPSEALAKILYVCCCATLVRLCQKLFPLGLRLSPISWSAWTKNVSLIHETTYLCSNDAYDKYRDVSLFLISAMMSREHQSYLFLKRNDMLFLRQFLSLFSCVEMFGELGITARKERSSKKPMESTGQRCQ